MKKLLAAILTASLCATLLAGCGAAPAPAAAPAAEEAPATEEAAPAEEVAEEAPAAEAGDVVYNIGICQLVQHVALDAATQGFIDVLTEKLGDQVTLLPTDTWGIALSPDGTHPSAEGYADLGVKLASYLAPKL